MYLAISLAVKAKSRNERLEENDEVETLAAEEKNWLALEAAGHSDEALAAIIYQPLQEKKASKAIAAQYAAYLVCTGAYGTDDELFNKLPPYLQTALSHLTIDPKLKTSERTGAVSGATISTDATVAAVTTTIQTSSTVQANATTNGI